MSFNPAPIPESDSSPRAQLDPANPTSQQNMTAGLDANPAGKVAGQPQDQHRAAPPSTVADYDYPNVPDATEPQQAASGPGQGQTVQHSHDNSVPFKEQVNGYAKKFAGTVFHNEKEKEFGEKKLEGQI